MKTLALCAIIGAFAVAHVNAAEPMIRHVVCFKFKATASATEIKAVEDAFAALKGKIKEVASLEWGTNNSPEGLNKGFTHCWIVSFKNDADRKVYLDHPEHRKFVEILKPALDEPFVIDFNVK